jgi:hypothetical protein
MIWQRDSDDTSSRGVFDFVTEPISPSQTQSSREMRSGVDWIALPVASRNFCSVY